jgi:hypothetical protein
MLRRRMTDLAGDTEVVCRPQDRKWTLITPTTSMMWTAYAYNHTISRPTYSEGNDSEHIHSHIILFSAEPKPHDQPKTSQCHATKHKYHDNIAHPTARVTASSHKHVDQRLSPRAQHLATQ